MTMTDTAEDQARAQYDSIAAMAARLTHAQECTTPDDCQITADAADHCGYWYSDPATVAITAADREGYHDPVHAAEAIDEHPLSVQVRGPWYPSGELDMNKDPVEYEILLCTGGPAVRMRGTLDQYSQPNTARLDYQDWGTPWTEYRHPIAVDDIHDAAAEATRYRETLLAYARQFYFGE